MNEATERLMRLNRARAETRRLQREEREQTRWAIISNADYLPADEGEPPLGANWK